MMHRPVTFDDAVLLAERADQTLIWNRNTLRPQYSQQRGHVSRAPSGGQGVSQYGNSRYKGPAPMVLGAVQRNQRSDIVCHHCGKKGHTKATCFQLHPELKTRGKKAVHMVQTTVP